MNSPAADVTAAEGAAPARSSRYAWYVVIVLMAAYTLSFIDRQILSLLVEPIKRELGASDTQIGLLQGLAFALFYTLLGLPMGWIVDRFNRRNLIVAGVALWTLMTAACGGARGFGTLFLARMGVGVGEATLSPAALSIIADYFPRERLGRALSVYSMGVFIGSGLALAVGGAVVAAVSEHPPVTLPLFGTVSAWRLTFLIVGLPGLLVAAVISTLREPFRTGMLTSGGAAVTLSWRESLREIHGRRHAIAGIAMGMACHAICMYGTLAWMPTFFVRQYHWPVGQAGLVLGLTVLIVGCSGMYLGGRLCDYYQQRGVGAAPLKIGVLAAVAVALGLVAALVVRSPALSWILLVPGIFGLAMPIGCMFAALQLILPNQVRGQVSALYLFVISLVGISLGPLVPGLINDYALHDSARIGDSLAMSVGVAAVAMGLAFRATYSVYAKQCNLR